MPCQGFRLTDFGQRIINKALIGKGLHLTRAVLGDGELGNTEIGSLTSVISEKMSILISGVLADDNASKVIFRVASAALEEGFYCKEYSLYARDPDTNEEGAYLYDHSRDGGIYIGGKDDAFNQVDSVFRLHVKFAQTDEITFDVGGTPLYVLYAEYADKVARMENQIDDAAIKLTDHEARIKALEDALFNNITGNPWSVRFENLNGLTVTGVYNAASRRIEC